MLPLAFILLVTGVCIRIVCQLTPETTWLHYYLGGMAGMFLSGCALEIWNKRRRKGEMARYR
jgi:hypothetical protein